MNKTILKEIDTWHICLYMLLLLFLVPNISFAQTVSEFTYNDAAENQQGSEYQTYNKQLIGSGSISGRVTDGQSNPIANATVWANYWGDGWAGGTKTDANGYYSISNLPSGQYRVQTEAPGKADQFYNNTCWYAEATPVTVNAPNVTQNINFTLTVPGGSISGIVCDNQGDPIADISVDCILLDGDSDFDKGEVTGTDGSYTISGLPFGNYIVTAPSGWVDGDNSWRSEWFNEKSDWEEADNVLLSSSNPNVNGINFILDNGFPSSVEFIVGQSSCYVDNDEYTMGVPAVNANGHVCVSVRYIAEPLDLYASWDVSTQTITLERNNMAVCMQVGSTAYYVNDQLRNMDVTPYISDGRTWIPVKYIAEAYGYSVIEDNNSIELHYGDNNQQLSRAELAFLLCNKLELQPGLPEQASFTDVPLDYWAASYIYALSEAGHVNGYPDGSFMPDSTVTRGELAVLIKRSFNISTYSPEAQTFIDVSPSHWAYSSIESLVHAGIVTGYPDGKFYPDTEVTTLDAINLFNKSATSQELPSSIDFVVGQSSYYVDNNEYTMDVSALYTDGHVFVPFLYAAGEFGLYVTWDSSSQRLTFERDNVVVGMQVGSTNYYVNDQLKQMDVAPFIDNGRTWIPVKYIAEAYGYSVIEDGSSIKLLYGDQSDECFIATAAYGSKFEPAVVLLRQFRDRYLLTNPFGKAFVDFYYRHSPPIAKFIAVSESLKFIVRVMLTPIVTAVYLIFHPIWIGVIAIGAWWVYRRRTAIH